MKSIPTKHIISTLAISFISLGATAGLALPVSARWADVVAPTFVVSGVICGQSGSVIATLLPGQSLAGDVVITSNPGSLFMADSNGSFLQNFIATNPASPQPFTVTNRAAGTDTIFACNSSLALLSVVNAKVIDTATGLPIGEGGANGPIDIKVDAHATNNNTNGNNINVSNLLRNVIGRGGHSSDNNTHHHHKNHHHNNNLQHDDQASGQRNNHHDDQDDQNYGHQRNNHHDDQDDQDYGGQRNNHHGNQDDQNYGRHYSRNKPDVQYNKYYGRQHNAHYGKGSQHGDNGKGNQHNMHQTNQEDNTQ